MLRRLCLLRRRTFKLVLIFGVFMILTVYIQSRISNEANVLKRQEQTLLLKGNVDALSNVRSNRGAGDSFDRVIKGSTSEPFKVVKPVLLDSRHSQERPSVSGHKTSHSEKIIFPLDQPNQKSKVFHTSQNVSTQRVPNSDEQQLRKSEPNNDQKEKPRPLSNTSRRQLNSHQNLPPAQPRLRNQLQQKSSKAKPSGIAVRIMPKRPSVPEGRSLMVTCADVKVLGRDKPSEEAPYMTFELPESMPNKLKNAVHILVRPGIVSLRFSHIRKGHAGTYTCVVEDNDGKQYKYNVPIEVQDGIGDLDGEAMGLNRQRQWKIPSKNDPRRKESLTQEQIDKMVESREKKWAKLGMMDAYEYDYDKVDDVIEDLHDRVGSPAQANLTALTERGKFQQKQIDQFCEARGFGDAAFTLPGENEGQYPFYRHMLVNDKAKTLFCFVPKVGCTNLKILFFVVQGFMPLSQLFESRDRVNQQRIEDVQLQESFLNRNDINRAFTLKHYFKFMMVRNPLHRLVSGFRSKVQRYPLTGLNDSKPHYNFLRKAIYLHVHPKEYTDYLKMRGRTEVNITFSDFITYWLLQPEEIKFDEHFRSMFTLCQPCRTRFNFYADFKNFEKDTQVLVKKINARPEFIRTGYYLEKESTEMLSSTYYAQLTQVQKLAVLKQVELDLDFYYHLFPDEKGIHNSILGLEKPVSIPLQR